MDSCNHAFWRQDGLCYFCRKENRWKDITLADGCIVPTCGVCYVQIEEGKKLAEERGFYKPSRLPISQKPATRNGEIGKGDKNMANKSFTEFVSDNEQEFSSAKLSSIVNIPFTLKSVKKEKLGAYDGIIITITESLDADGKKTDEFYTTSGVLVKKFTTDDIINTLNNGDTIGPLKIISSKSKSTGRNYLDVVAA